MGKCAGLDQPFQYVGPSSRDYHEGQIAGGIEC